MKALIKRILRKVYYILKYGNGYCLPFIQAEKSMDAKNPRLNDLYAENQRKKCVKAGFTSDKLIWYDFAKYGKTDYISDRDHFSFMEMVDKAHYFIANDKLVCERFLSPFTKVVPTLGILYKGRFWNISGNLEIDTTEDFIREMKNGGVFYIKPNQGGSATGIGRMYCKEGQFFWNDKSIDSINEYIRSMGYECELLVQRQFQQTGFSHDVNPGTLNTVRVVTMMSPHTGKPFVAWALHRFGRIGSYVDNVSKSGLSCPVDLETGCMRYATIYPYDGVLRKVDRHPDSGIQLAGVKIPQWEKVVDTCLGLAEKLPFMPLCGWDIVVSGEDVYMQELNYNPDIRGSQAHAPLLLNKEIKEFYNYYKEKYS